MRGIEVHGAAVERAIAGHRAALNLGGIAVDELARGDLLAHPGRVAASHILDVELRYLRDRARPARRAHARSSSITAPTQVLATLALVDTHASSRPAAPRSRSSASTRTTPLAALPGDRFIVRGFVADRDARLDDRRRPRHPRARAEGAQGRRARRDRRGARRRARLDQRIALDIQAAAFAGPRHRAISCAGSASPPPRSPSRSRRSSPPASCSRPVTASTRTTSTRSAVAELEARIAAARRRRPPTACRARSSAPSSPPRCRRAPTTRSSPASSAAASLVTDGDRVRKAAAPARRRRSRPSRPSLLDAARATGRSSRRARRRSPPRSRSPSAQVKTALDRLVAAQARRSRSSPISSCTPTIVADAPRAAARVPRRARDDRRAAVEGPHRREPQVHHPARRVLRRREAHAPRRRRRAGKR